MSPERYLNEPVDGRSDLYSLGVIFYAMLSGMVKFSLKVQLTYRQAAQLLLLAAWLVAACTGLVTGAARLL